MSAYDGTPVIKCLWDGTYVVVIPITPDEFRANSVEQLQSLSHIKVDNVFEIAKDSLQEDKNFLAKNSGKT